MTPPRRRQKKKTSGASASHTPPRHASTTNKKIHRKVYKPYRMRLPRIFLIVPLVLLLGFGGVFGFFAGKEIRTSELQSDYMSAIARGIAFDMEDGPSPNFFVPAAGPYNQRLGYSYIPFFIKSLEGENYEIAAQMRTSKQYQELVENEFYPIYHPKDVAGLRIDDRYGAPLYNVHFPTHVFKSFESVPKILIDTLLFIENRELLKDGPVTRNPAIEWDRFLYAAVGQGLKILVPNLNLGGGSTLATQIEKFRFSPEGQTRGIKEKLRQIISASLRVYLDGPDTRRARERIILDYLNSTPLSARPGFGEINSIGDGMWAWFGRDIDQITDLLNQSESDSQSLRKKATVYREVLGLILAQRRPTYYLLTDRRALDDLTDQSLENLAKAGVISMKLRDATRASSFRFLPEPPPPPLLSFLDHKATNALRNHLLTRLGLRNFYELDRIDLGVTSSLDQKVQVGVISFLKSMTNPDHVRAHGFYGYHLLGEQDDLSKIKWSVLIYERAKEGNLLRVQADNIDAPLDMNEGGKLDLGSTAKLRTLVTYLEIVGELYRRYAGLSVQDLTDLVSEAPDALTLWATTWLADYPNATLDEMLQAAMDRKYSANPSETFFTGGGAHSFVNFEHSEDSQVMDLHAALRDSVNLVFVRLMRDIVNYTIAQGQQTKQELLSDPDHPARKAYLERYADKEGSTFISRYVSEYARLTRKEIIQKISSRAHKGATARAILFRSIISTKAPFGAFLDYMKENVTGDLPRDRMATLYEEYPPNRYNLSDAGYITGINPMELWVVAYRLAHPDATRKEMLAKSQSVRQESYAWLFHSNHKGAQDTRIRILLELDAFARIQRRWERLGYPFDKLVPSFATAIGSSADRPGALAELVGILLNDGIRKPTLRFEKLHFAKGTPFETILTPAGTKAERVLDPAIARVARGAMVEVIENGTARRLRGAYLKENGEAFVIGGKTGTGDHRFDEYGPGHRLISSRVVNRTGTAMFFIGDKFFGTVTAHVAGEEAGNFKFTSAVAAQMLKELAPILQPIMVTPSALKPLPVDASLAYEPPTPNPIPVIESLIEPPVPEPVLAPAPARVTETKTPPKPKAIKKAPPQIKTPVDNYDLMMDVLPR